MSKYLPPQPFLILRFLARAPLGDALFIHARAVSQTSRVAATCTTSAIVRMPTARKKIIVASSQRFELLLCSSSTLGIPYFA